MKPLCFLLLILSNLVSLQGQICFQFDSTFGNNGLGADLHNDFRFETDIKKILVQTDQRIILVGAIFNGIKTGVGIKGYTANGQTDHTFAFEGRVYSAFGDSFYPNSAVLQKDQKIIVSGNIYADGKYQLGIIRYSSNGSLDTEFGVSGLVKSSFSLVHDDATSIIIQADGKIVIAGNSWDQDGASRFMVVRYLSNGTIDSTFASNGKSFNHLGPIIEYVGNQVYGKHYHDLARKLLIQPDGKLIVLGVSYVSCSDFEYYGGLICRNVLGMLRYHPNGSLDSSFGNAGKVLEEIFYNINSAALQDDGKILVTGSGNRGTFMTARFNQDGKLDNNFGTNGIVVFAHQTYSNTVPIDILIGQEGKIIVVGNAFGTIIQLIAIQYNRDGSPTDAFATNNSVRLHFGSQNAYNFGHAAGIQGNNILITGVVDESNNSELLLFRLSSKLPKPEILFNGFRLITQPGYAHYQWYLNGTAILGSDTSSFKPSQTGAYQVVVTNNEGCTNTSDYFPHLILASKEISLGKIKLSYYPNPVHNMLNIDMLEFNGQKLTAELYELNGKIVHRQILNQFSNQLPTHHLAPGIYQLHLKSMSESRSTKIMVVK